MSKGNEIVRAEIIVGGRVQGVGFRYFVLRNALQLGIKGYVKNLITGEVLTVAEGERFKLEELAKLIKIGPTYSDVKKFKVAWLEATNEFENFEVRF